ncbi:MAG: hypothetical protein ACW967_02935 [Candidatus Hodarchaeales archaeon]|jgi:hypothetical protein
MSNGDQCKEKEKIGQSLGEIDNPTINEMIETAEAFFDAASCFDSLGDRRNSAKNYTLAGEFFMSIDEKNRAAECYGKAILRNLMADELESARVLLDKGKDYGDHFDTFHFRLATDSFSRRITDEFDSLYDEAYYGFVDEASDEDEEIQLFDDVPTSSLLEQAELEEILVEDNDTKFKTTEEGLTKVSLGTTKGYKISSKIDSEKRGRIIDTLIFSAKQKDRVNIISNLKAKSIAGNSVKLTQKMDISIFDDLSENIPLLSDEISSSDDVLEDIEITDIDLLHSNLQQREMGLRISEKSIKDGILPVEGLDLPNLDTLEDTPDSNVLQSSVNTGDELEVNDLLTQVSDFVSLSEIQNPETDDLENLEIKDAIPLNWQIKGIKASKDMVLLGQEVDNETGSLIFKWKRNKLRAGEKAKIKYILSKRIQRTIISVIQDQILIQTLYYDIEKSDKVGLVADIPYQSLSSSKIDFLLIEDIIPPELKVTGIIPSDLAFLQYHTRDGLLFRWVMTSVLSTFPLNIQYQMIERPLSISLKHDFYFKEYPDSLLTLNKVVEPLIDVLAHEYLIYYELTAKNLPACVIDIHDSLYPKKINVELVASNPTWMRPAIQTESDNHKIYEWINIEIDNNKTRRFIVRVRTDQPLKSVDPVISIRKADVIASPIKSQIQEEITLRENLDLRRKMGLSRLAQE